MPLDATARYMMRKKSASSRQMITCTTRMLDHQHEKVSTPLDDRETRQCKKVAGQPGTWGKKAAFQRIPSSLPKMNHDARMIESRENCLASSKHAFRNKAASFMNMLRA
ncbi:MAG: hypothetical protein M0R18_11285 [Deltaproteobacteria bacterium]|nr:hypothetical protein [Deltaproteobacteria bacterium]